MGNRASQHQQVTIQRAYDRPDDHDAFRILVDRFWPRGCRRESLQLDGWAKELAPSAALIKWFRHQTDRWPAFRERYLQELASAEQRDRLRQVLELAAGRPITLVYGARDPEHNQAVVLRECLETLLKPANGRSRGMLPA